MLQPIGSHARYIQSVLRGNSREDAATPDYVKRSWVRCLSQYKLDPQSQREPFVLPREERLAPKELKLPPGAFAGARMGSPSPPPGGAARPQGAEPRAGVFRGRRNGSSLSSAGRVWILDHPDRS